MPAQTFAQTRADEIDNIAPTPLQAGAAWQYALTDNFLSIDEQSAVLRRQIEGDLPLLQNKLSEVGITSAFLAANPQVEEALFSGRPTPIVTVILPNDLELSGRLRIVATDQGTQLRITPVMPDLTIPDRVGDLQLTRQERQDLEQKGFVEKPIQIAENGSFVPAYLRVDKETNTVDIWKVRPEMLPTQLLGIDLSREQQLQLAAGYPVRLSGLKDRQGEPFDATLSVSAAYKGLQVSNISRQDVTLKPDEKNRQQLAQNNEGAKTDQVRILEEKTGVTTVANAQKETIKRLLTDDQIPNQNRKILRPKQ